MRNTRKCPTCNQVMMARVSHGVEIDICGACGGFWLDVGELDALLKGRFDVGDVESALDGSAKLPTKCRYCNVEHADGGVTCAVCRRDLGIGCPVDGRGMHVVRFGELELDRCSTCRGLWIDGFEREGLGEQAKNMQRERATVLVVPVVAAGFGAGDWSSESDWGGGSAGVQRDESTRQAWAGPSRLDVQCEGCKRTVNRYSAWAWGQEYWCLQCAERSDVKAKLQATAELQRTMHESAQKRGLPDDGGTWNRRYDHRSAGVWRDYEVGFELLSGVLRALFRVFHD